jgi:predicted ester cyclase
MAPGRDGIRRAFAELRAAFPDYHATVEDVIVEGNKAACRITGRLIYAGREVSLHGIDILQFDGDVLVARWGQFEPLPA